MKKITSRFLFAVLIFLQLMCSCGAENSQIPPSQKQKYETTPYVDYRLSDIPEFVDDLEKCTNTEKQYVLSDGYLYSFEPVPTYDVTNQLRLSTNEDGSVFNEWGYQDNARIRGILEIGETDYSFITGFIPIKAGDIIYFSGNCFDPQFVEAHVMNIAFFNTDKQVVGKTTMRTAEEVFFEFVEKNEDGYISALKVHEGFDELAYVRLTLIGSGVNQIISVNDPLVVSYNKSEWIQVKKYIPEDWYTEIKATIETITSMQQTDESSIIKFLFAADIHLGIDPSTSYTENLGKVSAEVMRACEIPFFITGGDNCTQSAEHMPSVFEENMEGVLAQLSPIPHKNILLALGNHDGETGICDYQGETVYYRFQLNNEERSSVFFDWQRESNEYKRFNSDGTYYFLDDSSTKTRYIILNSFWSKWEGNDDGFVSDIQHSFGHNPIFGPEQLMWFAEEALDMPPEYSAIIVTHFAPDAKDFDIFRGIVDAFSNQTIYKGSYEGIYEWQSTDIAVNYRNANGEIIAVFQGHRHTDAEYEYFDNVPCINTTTAGAYWAVRDEDAEERIKGTSSEFAVDAVVIDRVNRKIYITRLGVGKDRIIEY